jgi:hypothetical protein
MRKGWEETLAFIRARQADMPPHLRGLEHNADEHTTNLVTAAVAAQTQVPLLPGDLWVRETEAGDALVGGPFSPPPHATSVEAGQLAFGYLTRAGEIAVHKIQAKP